MGRTPFKFRAGRRRAGSRPTAWARAIHQIESTRARYRAWLLERHSPAITAALQRDVYASMLDGTFEPGTAAPDQWAKMLDERPREDR